MAPLPTCRDLSKGTVCTAQLGTGRRPPNPVPGARRGLRAGTSTGRIASGAATSGLGVRVCALEYVRSDFLSSGFGLHFTDTV